MFALWVSEYATQVERLRSPRYIQAQVNDLAFPNGKQFQNRTVVNHSKSDSSHHYFLGKANTRAEIAEFFNVPPTIKGPKGVNTIPWVSARTS